MTLNDHCCEKMKYYIDLKDSGDTNVSISYNKVFREYGIDVIDDDSIIRIFFCPWCGKELPDNLSDEWFETLEEMFEDFDGFADPRIPDAFKTDEWWKSK